VRIFRVDSGSVAWFRQLANDHAYVCWWLNRCFLPTYGFKYPFSGLGKAIRIAGVNREQGITLLDLIRYFGVQNKAYTIVDRITFSGPAAAQQNHCLADFHCIKCRNKTAFWGRNGLYQGSLRE
jgi:hypothetical protein